jgi:phage terminase large subunit-like protein
LKYTTAFKIRDQIRALKRQYNLEDDDEESINIRNAERKLYEGSFYEFVKAAWHVVEGRRPYVDNWHIQAMCDHLEATYYKDIMNMIVNIPPRCGKSLVLNVFFPAWVWTKDPSLRFLYASYASTLALRDSANCRSLITSEWYRRLWGDKVHLRRDANSKKRYYNTRGGFRMITSISSSIIGEGGDWQIIDDPDDRNTIDSPLMRSRTHIWHDETFSTRVQNPKETRFVIQQQRLHELDLSGWLLISQLKESYVHLCLPMEFDSSRRCVTVPLKGTGGKKWRDPRKRDGELLWPHHWDLTAVERLKKRLGSSYAISGQLNQLPSPAEGAIIKGSWFNWWKGPLPRCHFILQSWDTALSSGEESSFSAASTWGIFDDPDTNVPQIILLNLWRGKLEYPDLRRMARRLARNYNDVNFEGEPLQREQQPHMILIEAKASGQSLIEDLRRAGVYATPFNPNKAGTNFDTRVTSAAHTGVSKVDQAKVARARLVTSIIEAGRVWLPTQYPHYEHLTPFADVFYDAAVSFPKKASNDIIDTMSMSFIKLMKADWVQNPEDPQPLPSMQIWEKEPLY